MIKRLALCTLLVLTLCSCGDRKDTLVETYLEACRGDRIETTLTISFWGDTLSVRCVPND